MSEPLHDIDKLFYDNIEGHSEYPPKKVWDKIEAGLDKDTAVIYRKKYRALKRAAAILLVLFLGVLLYEIAGRRPGKETVAGTQKKNEQKGNSATPQSDNANKEEINKLSKKDNDISANPASDEKSPLTQPDDNSISQKNELPDNQSLVILPSSAYKAGKRKNIVRNNRQDKEKESSLTEKLKKNNNSIQNQGGVEVVSIENGNKQKATKSIDSSFANEAANTDPVKDIAQKDVSTIEFITGRPRSRNLAAVWDYSSLTIPENGSLSILEKLNYSKAKKSINPFRNYGFSITGYFSPQATWNSIHDDKPYRPGGLSNGPVDHDEIKRSERNSFAYSGGIKLGYGISKKVSLQAGLNYTRSSTTVRPKDIYAEQDNNGNVHYRFDCSSGYTYVPPHSGLTPAPGDSISLTSNHNILAYLGIPLAIEYRFSFGKFSLSASAGVQVNILLEGKTTVVLGKNTSDETSVSTTTEGLKRSYFSAVTSITGELQLNKKLSLVIAPTGQFGLSPINEGASVKTRPNYLGLATGLKLRL
jgi:hypothetical protein